MGEKKKILILMNATIFLASFGFIMYSALLPSFSERYRITLSEAGLVGSILCMGQLFIIFLNDFLAAKLSKTVLIAGGVFLHLLSMFWIAFSPSYGSLLAAFFVNGAAISLLNVVMSAYISDLSGERRNSYLNIFHGIYGLGSLAGPLLPTIVLAAGGSWTVCYLIVGAISIMLFFAVLLFARGNAGEVQKEPGGNVSFFRLLKNPGLLLSCAAAMLYMGFDMMISTYMSSYLGLKLGAAAIAGLTITFYWAGSALGRLLYSMLFAKVNVRRYLAVVNILTAVALFVGMGVLNKWVMLVLIFAVGLLSGVNFPLDIGIACGIFPKQSVAATNAISIFGSLGGIIFPALAGRMMEKTGYQSLLVIGGILMMLIAALMLLLERIKKKEKEGGKYTCTIIER